jgi:hypothetical protein
LQDLLNVLDLLDLLDWLDLIWLFLIARGSCNQEKPNQIQPI